MVSCSFLPRQKLRHLARGQIKIAKEYLLQNKSLPAWLSKILPGAVAQLSNHHGDKVPDIVQKYTLDIVPMGQSKWSQQALSEKLASADWLACGRGACQHWVYLSEIPHGYCEGCANRWPDAVLREAVARGATVRGYVPNERAAPKPKGAGFSLGHSAKGASKSNSKGGDQSRDSYIKGGGKGGGKKGVGKDASLKGGKGGKPSEGSKGGGGKGSGKSAPGKKGKGPEAAPVGPIFRPNGRRAPWNTEPASHADQSAVPPWRTAQPEQASVGIPAMPSQKVVDDMVGQLLHQGKLDPSSRLVWADEPVLPLEDVEAEPLPADPEQQGTDQSKDERALFKEYQSADNQFKRKRDKWKKAVNRGKEVQLEIEQLTTQLDQLKIDINNIQVDAAQKLDAMQQAQEQRDDAYRAHCERVEQDAEQGRSERKPRNDPAGSEPEWNILAQEVDQALTQSPDVDSDTVAAIKASIAKCHSTLRAKLQPEQQNRHPWLEEEDNEQEGQGEGWPEDWPIDEHDPDLDEPTTAGPVQHGAARRVRSGSPAAQTSRKSGRGDMAESATEQSENRSSG
jgi:hypothetical protein